MVAKRAIGQEPVRRVEHLGELPGEHAGNAAEGGAPSPPSRLHPAPASVSSIGVAGSKQGGSAVEVDVVELKALQAGVDAMPDVLGGEAAFVGGRAHGVEDLGGHDDLLSRDGEFAEGPAEDFLAGSIRVHIGRVGRS